MLGKLRGSPLRRPTVGFGDVSLLCVRNHVCRRLEETERCVSRAQPTPIRRWAADLESVCHQSRAGMGQRNRPERRSCWSGRNASDLRDLGFLTGWGEPRCDLLTPAWLWKRPGGSSRSVAWASGPLMLSSCNDIRNVITSLGLHSCPVA